MMSTWIRAAPDLLFIAAALWQWARLRRADRALRSLKSCAQWNIGLYLLKMLCLIVFITVAATWQVTGPAGYCADVASTTLLLAAIVSLPLVHYEHYRAKRASGVLTLWLILGLTADAFTIASPNHLYPINMACRVLLLALDNIPKAGWAAEADSMTPEETASFISRCFFLWLLPLQKRACSHTLRMSDLFGLGESLTCDKLNERFEEVWEVEKDRHGLLWVLCRAFREELLSSIGPLCISATLSAVAPWLLYQLLRYIESPDKDAHERRQLVLAFIVTAMAFPIANGLGMLAASRSAVVLRGVLFEAVFRKALRVDTAVAANLSSGLATSLLSSDVPKIAEAWTVHYMPYFSLMMLIVGLVIIFVISSPMVCAVTAASLTAACLFTTRFMTRLVATQKEWSVATDKRTKLTTSLVRNIQAIRVSPYTAALQKLFGRARSVECQQFWAWRMRQTVLAAVANSVTDMAAIPIILCIAFFQPNIRGASLYAIIATVQILQSPLSMAGQDAGTLLSAKASLDRIESFLRTDETPKRTVFLPQSNALPYETSTVHFNNASLGWQSHLLRDITWTASEGLTLIYGRVGSGKSTLLHAILNEVPMLSGEAGLPGGCAFAAQEPWLQSGSTIQQNIVFVEAYDETWYQQVLRAVAMDVDVASFDKGDERRAIGLSGGQRARIALARAIYASRRLQVVILDDVLASVDSNTNEHIFRSLFGPSGLLKGKTTIFATNDLSRASEGQHLVLLDDGQIVEQGSSTDLLTRDSKMQKLYTEYGSRKHGSAKDAQTAEAMEKGEYTADDGEEDVSIEQEVAQTHSKARWPSFIILFTMPWQNAVGGLTVNIIAAACPPAAVLLAHVWLQRQETGALIAWIILLAAFSAPFTVSWLLMFDGAIKAFTQISTEAISALLSAPYSVVSAFSSGVLTQRFAQDLPMCDREWTRGTLNCYGRGGEFLFRLAFLIVASPYASIGLIPFVLTVWLVRSLFVVLFHLMAYCQTRKFYVKLVIQLRRLGLASRSPVIVLFSDIMSANGLRTVRALSAQSAILQQHSRLCEASQAPYYLERAGENYLELMSVLEGGFITIAMALAIVYGPAGVASLLAPAATSVTGLALITADFVKASVLLELANASVSRLLELRDLPGASKVTDVEPFALTGSVGFDNATLRYHLDDRQPALDGVTFELKAGESCGIVGRTGSGKTSLFNALFGLYSLEQGRVLVDGRDISQLDRQSLLSSMTIVSQESLFLDTSLRNNLDPELVFMDAELWEALKTVSCADLVRSLPDKLDADVSVSTFSTGQRALLALARAILRDSRIVCLDEASASIDQVSERALHQALQSGTFQEATTMIIAHRIQSVLHCDRVIVMHQGRIIEDGPPSDLLAKEGGALRALAGEEMRK